MKFVIFDAFEESLRWLLVDIGAKGNHVFASALSHTQNFLKDVDYFAKLLQFLLLRFSDILLHNG